MNHALELFLFFFPSRQLGILNRAGISTQPPPLSPQNASRSQELLSPSEYISFASAFSYTEFAVWSLLCCDLQCVHW